MMFMIHFGSIRRLYYRIPSALVFNRPINHTCLISSSQSYVPICTHLLPTFILNQPVTDAVHQEAMAQPTQPAPPQDASGDGEGEEVDEDSTPMAQFQREPMQNQKGNKTI